MAAAPERTDRHSAEAIAAKLPPLLVAAERVAATVAQGVHGRRRVGQGETFWQFRRYEITDSAQMIDWRQSAKTQHLFVRETEWEAAQSVWLWRDASPSMAYSSNPRLPEKRDRAALLLLALASLLIRAGERIAALDSNDPPSHSRRTLDQLANTILTYTASEDLPVYRPLPRHGQVVLIGDLLGPIDPLYALVHRFAADGLSGHLVQVLDPAEEALPFRGRTRFLGMEGEGDVLIRKTENARDTYQDRLRRHREDLQTIARRTGWSFITHHTDSPPETALLSLYMTLSGVLEK